jgi:hypothetical protein
VLGEPDPFLPARLRLSDSWLTSTGEWRLLRDEGTVPLWSVLGYLRWHAPTLMRREPDGLRFGDPYDYLASRPLVVAIDAELARRGACEPGMVLATLRAAGSAPWELAPDRRAGRRR